MREYLSVMKDVNSRQLVNLLDRYEEMWSITVLEERYISIRDKMVLESKEGSNIS